MSDAQLRELAARMSGADVFDGDILALASWYCDKIGIAETVDRLVERNFNVSLGVQCKALILDALAGRSPLYRVADAFALRDVGLLLGEGVKAESLDDNLLGRGLDAVYDFGAKRLFGEVAAKAVAAFDVNCSTGHYDTTSVSVHGDYSMCQESPEEAEGKHPVRIVRGHSKDKRGDLKQLVIETLCVERNIPVLGAARDGNSSDKRLANQLLTDISKAVARSGEFSNPKRVVADSALVTNNNLASLGGTLFLSRLPANYEECHRLIEDAIKADKWLDVGCVQEAPDSSLSTRRPPAKYRLLDTTAILDDIEYRALVVHSDHLDERRTRTLAKDDAISKEKIEELCAPLLADYACEADALAACERINSLKAELHRARPLVTTVEKRGKGRPRNDGANVGIRHRVRIEIEPIAERLERRRLEVGCFVLLSNIPTHGEDSMSGEELLREYKGQQGVERGFSFIKDPMVVNAIFLKTPERIEALGFILLCALLVWNLIERDLRKFIKEEKATLPGWDGKQTERPTTFMFSTKFINVKVLKKDGQRILIGGLPGQLAKYFDALKLSADVFLRPWKIPNPAQIK